MSDFKKFESSSKRPILVGKTITKQLSDKKEFDEYIKVTNVLNDAGFYEVFTYNPKNFTVTYDFIEGSEYPDITKINDMAYLIERYSKKLNGSGLLTIDKMQESITGFKWCDKFYELCETPMEYLCHDDINKVNTVLSNSGEFALIDWERASLGPKYYDLGSWLVNRVQYDIDHPKYRSVTGKYIDRLATGKYADLAKKYALIDASFLLSYKDMIAKKRKVYGREGLKNIINYLKNLYL